MEGGVELQRLELRSLSSGRAIAGVALPAIVLNGEDGCVCDDVIKSAAYRPTLHGRRCRRCCCRHGVGACSARLTHSPPCVCSCTAHRHSRADGACGALRLHLRARSLCWCVELELARPVPCGVHAALQRPCPTPACCSLSRRPYGPCMPPPPPPFVQLWAHAWPLWRAPPTSWWME